MAADRSLRSINWELTYACQLRCTHCYTESGRRAARKLPREALLRIADAIIAAGVGSVQFTGGEPLLVPELFELAERLRNAGVDRGLYTNGIGLENHAAEIARLFSRVHVSVDGPNALVHDRIRGREGSFDAAVRALHALDRAMPRETGEYGIDVTVIQSNLEHLDEFFVTVVPLFPRLRFAHFGVAMPLGLASRESFAMHELLTEAQLASVCDPVFEERLRAAAPRGVRVKVNDWRRIASIPRGPAFESALEIEPDGGVRGLIFYEGTVGNVLTTPLDALWHRARERLQHPLVLETLSTLETMSLQQWAVGARRIDVHFGSLKDRARLARRKPLVPGRGVA